MLEQLPGVSVFVASLGLAIYVVGGLLELAASGRTELERKSGRDGEDQKEKDPEAITVPGQRHAPTSSEASATSFTSRHSELEEEGEDDRRRGESVQPGRSASGVEIENTVLAFSMLSEQLQRIELRLEKLEAHEPVSFWRSVGRTLAGIGLAITIASGIFGMIVWLHLRSANGA